VEQNMGFLSEIKHIFADIQKSLELESAYTDSVFLGAGLYSMLPGWPLSRGSNEKAVSWYRYGINVLENGSAAIDPERQQEVLARNRLNLAACLADRDWKAEKRKKEQEGFKKKYNKADDIIGEIDYYEGAMYLNNVSDMEEAKELYKKAENYYYGLKDVTDEELEEIKAMLKKVYQMLDK
jgi:hypothetical protein